MSPYRRETTILLPLHHELAKGTLLGILKQCGLTRGDLAQLLEKR